MENPKCFISYSWDSTEHQEWIKELGTHLQNAGVETRLDQWDLKPGQDLMAFMEYSIRSSDFVLLVCTRKYAQKSNEGQGGVGYEKNIITGEMFSSSEEKVKFIPIIRNDAPSEALPTFLKSKIFIDFRNDDEFEEKFEELGRAIYATPKFPKPPLGKKPDFSQPFRVKSDDVGKTYNVLVFEFNGVKYLFNLPDWWDEIEIDLSEITNSYDNIGIFCAKNYGADVGTPKTWKYALKAHAEYCRINNEFPVYIAHCASAGGENELAVKIYTDLFQLVEMLNKDNDWYHCYLAYEAGSEYEIIGQIGLAISWYKKATHFLDHKDKAIKYYAQLSLDRVSYFENLLATKEDN